MAVDSSFRSYVAPALLAVVALAFLIVGGPSKDAMVGAGFALAGAAAARAIDVAHERKRDAAEADANRRRDLDETRRLLYMALVQDVPDSTKAPSSSQRSSTRSYITSPQLQLTERSRTSQPLCAATSAVRANTGWMHRSSGSRVNSTADYAVGGRGKPVSNEAGRRSVVILAGAGGMQGATGRICSHGGAVDGRSEMNPEQYDDQGSRPVPMT